MRQIPILLGKSISQVSKALNRSGSTWPGHAALKIDSKVIQNVLKKNPNLKIVLIAGTNGKTTTAKFIEESLSSQGLKVFRNEAGANLMNGIASSLIKNSNLNGKLIHDIAIFEIDENTLPFVISELKETKCQISLILLNLFRDQLDRYGEVNTIAKNWQKALKDLPKESVLVTNGDDPMLRFIGEKSNVKTHFFGLSEKLMTKKEISSDVDFLYCPNCNTKLEYSKRSYSHMGIFKCPKCKFENDKTENFPTLPNPMLGLYNRYNINAASTLLTLVFNLKAEQVKDIIDVFSPAFGRQEKIIYHGKEVFLLLAKNPTGFNQSIESVLEHDKNPNVLLLLNDRIPDGRDISWIWDVDFEQLLNAEFITISGERTFDMALRIKYANIKNYNPIENLREAITTSSEKTPESKTLFILATYSAMLDTRNILKGRRIL